MEENRKISIDKSSKESNMKFIHKHLKINENEKKDLDLITNEMNLLVLTYFDQNGKEKEFIIGNLEDVVSENKRLSLSKYIKDINRKMDFINFTSQTEQYINRKISECMDNAKMTFEKNFSIKYLPEGYEFFYGKENYEPSKDAEYNTMVSVSINYDNDANNLIVYDNVKTKDLFKSKSYFENKTLEIESKVEEFYDKEKDVKKLYLNNIIQSFDKLIEFFNTNPNILNDVAMKDSTFKKYLENWKDGKTKVNDEIASNVICKAAIKYVLRDEELIENIKIPDEIHNIGYRKNENQKENDDFII